MKKIFFSILPSTNSYIKDNYNDLFNEDVIIANIQTNGRGRFDRVWLSDRDLTFSILFKDNKYNHSLIAPISIIYALKLNNIEAKIKWPNDIYVSGKKLSGILIEKIKEGKMDVCDIVGVGLNLSRKNDILNATYINIDKLKILDDILNLYQKYMKFDEEELLDLYYRYSMINNKKIIYHNEEYIIKGYTNSLALVCYNESKEIVITASEIDIKTSIIN